MTLFSIFISLCSFGHSADYSIKQRNSCIQQHVRCATKNRISWATTFNANFSNRAIPAFYQKCVLNTNRSGDGGYYSDNRSGSDYDKGSNY